MTMEQHDEHLDPEVKTKVIESLLVEKGLLSTDAIDAVADAYEKEVVPMVGAAIAARAWMDEAFKRRLLVDAPGAIAQLGFAGLRSETLVIVENTEKIHNVIVCTLCSCYPWAVLGLPPAWYKSPAYRSRIVREPREMLREFGLELDDDVQIRVWDSSAERRYMVLPQPPAGSGQMAEDELRGLITRNALIGVEYVSSPSAAVRSRTASSG